MTYEQRQQELLNKLPDDKALRSRISYMAYEQGHSGGEEEVLNALVGLVEDLAKPLAEFEARCRKEGPK